MEHVSIHWVNCINHISGIYDLNGDISWNHPKMLWFDRLTHTPMIPTVWSCVESDRWNCLAKKTTGLYPVYICNTWSTDGRYIYSGMGLENHFMTSRQICIFMWKIREMCFGYNQWSSNFCWISSCWVQNGGYSTWQFLTHEPWWETTPFWVPLLVDPSSTCFNELITDSNLTFGVEHVPNDRVDQIKFDLVLTWFSQFNVYASRNRKYPKNVSQWGKQSTSTGFGSPQCFFYAHRSNWCAK